MTSDMHDPGVDAGRDMAWGTHVGQFYETRRDLLECTMPFFRVGLERGERCVWIVSHPFTVDEATDAVRREIPDGAQRLAAGDVEVKSYTDAYFEGGSFSGRRLLDHWRAAMDDALERGYHGLRGSGDGGWLTGETREAFMEYERALTEAIAGRRMIVLCAYPLQESTGAQVLDVVRAHQSTMALRRGTWEAIEVVELAEARAEMQRRTEELETRVAQRTQELATANEQLRQSQKMEAIGRLAGGIAHDFNGLLTVITGYSALTLGDLRPDDPLRDNVKEIAAASDRAAALTRQLLAFSRRQVLQPKVIDLNAVVGNMERMLQRIIGEDVAFRTVLDPSLGRVRADPGQIEQVIMNLVVNARDAMPRGGALTIETRNVELTAGEATTLQLGGSGPHVALVVRDTGTGIDDATKSRIFEPFFTTKEVGKGTGLGLSTVYGIVRQSDGGVHVDSEVDRGTTFTLYLPRLVPAAEEQAPAAPARAAPKGSETILVAEDDAMVRTLIRRVLRAQGYQTLDAADGATALQLCQRHPEPIHLLVSDVVMPGMSGRELMEHLARYRPEMRFLFMSGYTDDSIVHHGVLDSDIPFLQKPFAPETLARKVREVLDADQRPVV